MGTVKAKIRDNPMVYLISSVIIATGLVTGTVAAINEIDQLILTHAEHAADMKPIKAAMIASEKAISELQTWNKCARLEQRMDTLEDRLFNQIQSGSNSSLRHDTKIELSKVERQFNAHNCARVLAWIFTRSAPSLARN